MQIQVITGEQRRAVEEKSCSGEQRRKAVEEKSCSGEQRRAVEEKSCSGEQRKAVQRRAVEEKSCSEESCRGEKLFRRKAVQRRAVQRRAEKSHTEESREKPYRGEQRKAVQEESYTGGKLYRRKAVQEESYTGGKLYRRKAIQEESYTGGKLYRRKAIQEESREKLYRRRAEKSCTGGEQRKAVQEESREKLYRRRAEKSFSGEQRKAVQEESREKLYRRRAEKSFSGEQRKAVQKKRCTEESREKLFRRKAAVVQMTDCMCRGCNTGSGASMHYIPKDPDIRQKWIDFIYKNRQAPKLRNLDRIRICSVHFPEECFTNYRQKMMGFGKRLILKPNAVPTLAVQTVFTAPSRTRREKLEEAVAEMRLCPLCQRRQKDSETLSMHLTKKHSVHPACLDNLLINAPYANRSSGVVSVSISQNSNGTSQEIVESPLIAVQLDCSAQDNGTHNKSGVGNSRSGFGNPEASVQEDKFNPKNNAAAVDSSGNYPFKCHACLEFFTHKSALSVHDNSATCVQKMITGNDGDSSTPSLAYPYVSTKPYQCDVCHVSYFYSFGLESHLKSVLHQSRTRKAENAAANSKTNTETRIVMANLAGTPLANATQLATAKTCNCSTQADKFQLQAVSPLHPASVMTAQAVPTVLPVLRLTPNSVPHTIVPSVIPLSGTPTAQLIPQSQMLMPLIVNGLQTQSATPDGSQQILQQAVSVFDLCSARQVKGLCLGDSRNQLAATGVSGASRVPLETNTTVDGVGVKVKIEIKEEPCDQEVSQMTPVTANTISPVGLKQEQNGTWDGIEETVLCGDKQPSKAKEVSMGMNSKRQCFDANQASTTQDCHNYLASKPSCTQSCSRLSPEPLELTEFQSQVLWAFIESRNEADSKSPPREDCEALGREVGLTEDEVRKWLMDDTHRTKDQHQADVQSLCEPQGNTEDDEDTLMIDESGGTVLRSTTDFLSDEEGADEQSTVDRKRKRDMD